MSYRQVKRFLSNEDFSIISIRPFNQSPIDKYPEITFCFEGLSSCSEGIFKAKPLSNAFGLNLCDFQDILEGGDRGVGMVNINNISGLDVSSIALNAAGIFAAGGTGTKKHGTVDMWKFSDGNAKNKFSMYKSYQTSSKVCFSHKSQLSLLTEKTLDYFTLNQT